MARFRWALANLYQSRDFQVQPPRFWQGHLGTCCLPLPRRRHDHLLPLLQPSGPQHLRAYQRISEHGHATTRPAS
jgi:hypothetical protein